MGVPTCCYAVLATSRCACGSFGELSHCNSNPKQNWVNIKTHTCPTPATSACRCYSYMITA